MLGEKPLTSRRGALTTEMNQHFRLAFPEVDSEPKSLNDPKDDRGDLWKEA